MLGGTGVAQFALGTKSAFAGGGIRDEINGDAFCWRVGSYVCGGRARAGRGDMGQQWSRRGARGEAEPNRVPFTARLVERALFVRRVLSGVA